MLLPEVDDAVSAALLRMTANYGALVDEDTFEAQLANWKLAMEDHEWVSADLVDAALEHFLYRDPGRSKVPPVGTFLEECRQIKRRHEQREAGERALPAPRDPSRPDPGAYARNIAIGKARQRKRNALINAYRATLPAGVWKYGGEQQHHWWGKDTPSEAEIDGVLREMHKAGQINADTLAAALELRVPINILNVEHLPSKIAVGTPGEPATPQAERGGGARTVVVDWKDGTRTVTAFGNEDAAAKAARFVKEHAHEWTAADERELLERWPHLRRTSTPKGESA